MAAIQVARTSAVQQGRRLHSAGAARTWDLATTVFACLLMLVFAYAHVGYWLDTGRPTGLVLAFQEAILVTLFVIRRRSRDTSRNPIDWAAGFVGSFGVLLFRPGGESLGGLDLLWTVLQVMGTLCSAWGAIYLGRSFGIVAANRGVRSSGPYRFVRHPMYGAYLLAHAGYLLSTLSLANVLVFAAIYVAQFRRMSAEESVLGRDADYRSYMQTTRRRLIPGLL